MCTLANMSHRNSSTGREVKLGQKTTRPAGTSKAERKLCLMWYRSRLQRLHHENFVQQISHPCYNEQINMSPTVFSSKYGIIWLGELDYLSAKGNPVAAHIWNKLQLTYGTYWNKLLWPKGSNAPCRRR